MSNQTSKARILVSFISDHALSRAYEKDRTTPQVQALTRAQLHRALVAACAAGVLPVEARDNGAQAFHVPGLGVDVVAHRRGFAWEIATITRARWVADLAYRVDPLRR